jgi:hypothetical protein
VWRAVVKVPQTAQEPGHSSSPPRTPASAPTSAPTSAPASAQIWCRATDSDGNVQPEDAAAALHSSGYCFNPAHKLSFYLASGGREE